MADTNAYNNYTATDIDRYVSGNMTGKEMHDMERAALQDPFLADAIEGFRNAEPQITKTHLNQIGAAIQGNKPEAKIIALPKQKRYGWQIAASAVIIISVSILIFTRYSATETAAFIAGNKQKDTFKSEDSRLATPPARDSLLAAAGSSSLSKRKERRANEEKPAEKSKETAPNMAVAAPQIKTDDKEAASSANSDSSAFQLDANASRQPAPVMADSLNNNLAEVIVTGYATRKAKQASANTWTTEKGKPFILSEVEVINVGRKQKKITDTSSVKPEGGWQSFHNYLFSKLSQKDTASFANATGFDNNLELEFSFNETGLPYNIKVFHAQDSTTASHVVSALQQGPKWISNDKKEKRLNIKY